MPDCVDVREGMYTDTPRSRGGMFLRARARVCVRFGSHVPKAAYSESTIHPLIYTSLSSVALSSVALATETCAPRGVRASGPSWGHDARIKGRAHSHARECAFTHTQGKFSCFNIPAVISMLFSTVVLLHPIALCCCISEPASKPHSVSQRVARHWEQVSHN